MKDILGREIQVGDMLAQGERPGSSGASLKLRHVVEVEEHQVKCVPYYSDGTPKLQERAYWSGKPKNTVIVKRADEE